MATNIRTSIPSTTITGPTACYGHVDRYDSARLHRIAHRLRCRHPGLTATVAEHHGGWLVLDSAA